MVEELVPMQGEAPDEVEEVADLILPQKILNPLNRIGLQDSNVFPICNFVLAKHHLLPICLTRCFLSSWIVRGGFFLCTIA